MFRDRTQKGHKKVCLWHWSTSNQQELWQRSGDCLPGNSHWPIENQPVCARWSPLQSVSVAANHYLQHEAMPWLCVINIILCSSLHFFILCASSEISWQRRTRRVCLMQITSLFGTREQQSRSLVLLSTPSPSAQVCRTKPVITAFNVCTLQHNISRNNYIRYEFICPLFICYLHLPLVNYISIYF